MPSIKEVARASGVSTATVSRILNKQVGAAGAETRDRVLEVVARLNYRPSAIARGLSVRRMNTVGVVLVSGAEYLLTPESYNTLILDGILAANKCLRQKTLLFYEASWSDAHENLSSYCDGHSDGLIFLTPLARADFFQTLRQHSVPFVTTGGIIVDGEVSIAMMDERAAGKAATRCLIEQGHRRIAHLTGEMNRVSGMLRCEGYQDALRGAGIPFEDALVLQGEYTDVSGYDRARLLLDLPESLRPTAFFCGDDSIAYGVLRAARAHGLVAPRDLSVIGINGGLEGALSDPPLTSVRQPFHQIGQALVEQLIAQVEGRTQPGTRSLYPGELVVRASVAPPPAFVGSPALAGNPPAFVGPPPDKTG